MKRFALHAYVGALAGSGLTPAALRVAMALSTHADRDGFCWPHLKTIIAETGLCRSSVLASLRELEEAGFAVIQKASASEKARGRGNAYTLTLPGEQVQKLGPAHEAHRSENLDQAGPETRTQAGPETWTLAAGIPLSVKDPVEQPIEPPTPAGAVAYVDKDEGGRRSDVDRILRESAKAHGRHVSGPAFTKAVDAVHHFVDATCDGWQAVATWDVAAAWACAPYIKGEPHGLGLLASDPGRYHKMEAVREGAKLACPPDWVCEIDRPGIAEAMRQAEAQRQDEAWQRDSLRWCPERPEAAAERERTEQAMRRAIDAINAPRTTERRPAPNVADWVIQSELRSEQLRSELAAKIRDAWARAYLATKGERWEWTEQGEDAVRDVAGALLAEHRDGAAAEADRWIAVSLEEPVASLQRLRTLVLAAKQEADRARLHAWKAGAA